MSFAGKRSEEVVWDGHRVDPSLLALDEDPVSIEDAIQEPTVIFMVFALQILILWLFLSSIILQIGLQLQLSFDLLYLLSTCM